MLAMHSQVAIVIAYRDTSAGWLVNQACPG